MKVILYANSLGNDKIRTCPVGSNIPHIKYFEEKSNYIKQLYIYIYNCYTKQICKGFIKLWWTLVW